MGHILKMIPVLQDKIWGGTRLRDEYGYDLPSETTGEAWVISAHPNGDCQIANGEYAGMTLSQLYQKHRELFGNIKSEQFPLLVKIIDASEDLSVQVHPDDEYAKKYENSLGKTESWYVLGTKGKTEMVMGHDARTKEEFISAVENDDYDHLLNVININKGDFFYIPSGTLHAICSGSLIYEAQQSSDITYRVYDYHRKDKEGNERELHIRQSIDVTKVPADLEQNKLFMNSKLDNGNVTQYLKCKFLSVYKYRIGGECTIQHDQPFSLLTVIEGEGSLNGEFVSKGDNFVICNDIETVYFDGTMDIMVTTL